MKFEIDIKPMSVNQAWQGRRFKTKKYKNWSEEFLWKLRKKKIKKIKGDVKIEIEWGYKFVKTMDIDNPTKLIIDRMVEAEIIDDDRNIWELFVKKTKSDKPYIKISIYKL